MYNGIEYVFDLEIEAYVNGEQSLTVKEYNDSNKTESIVEPTNAEIKVMLEELQTLILIQLGVIE